MKPLKLDNLQTTIIIIWLTLMTWFVLIFLFLLIKIWRNFSFDINFIIFFWLNLLERRDSFYRFLNTQIIWEDIFTIHEKSNWKVIKMTVKWYETEFKRITCYFEHRLNMSLIIEFDMFNTQKKEMKRLNTFSNCLTICCFFFFNIAGILYNKGIYWSLSSCVKWSSKMSWCNDSIFENEPISLNCLNENEFNCRHFVISSCFFCLILIILKEFLI